MQEGIDVRGKWYQSNEAGGHGGDWLLVRNRNGKPSPVRPHDDLVLFREPGSPGSKPRYVVAPPPRRGWLRRVLDKLKS